jgi:hypothetical protein
MATAAKQANGQRRDNGRIARYIYNKQIVRSTHFINKVIHGMQRGILISAIAGSGWFLGACKRPPCRQCNRPSLASWIYMPVSE